MEEKLHLEILPPGQAELFQSLSAQPFISDFYLAGGTCLALLIGHRQSLDFDFFIPDDFETSDIIGYLNKAGRYERQNEERNTINGSLNGVRISFFGYKYRIIDDILVYRNFRLAGFKDLAAMKLEAIAGRGSRKDFVDMYFLLKRFPLESIFEFHTDKYGTGLSNRYHHLKSLVYFADAEQEAMPVMRVSLDWDTVKDQIVYCVKKFTSGL